MADNGVLVTISGAALSLLLYENVRSAGDQIGLLLGNIQTFITKNVTDCDRQVEHVKHHINIDTVVTCPKDILQNPLGKMNTAKLEQLIKNKEKRVVGWFRFRRHNFLTQTLRDKIMHKEFASHFLGFNRATEEHFIMFLLNASTTNSNQGTHKYRHLCLQYKRGTFQPVALRINNLGADAARHDGSDYKPVPANEPREADVFTSIVDNLMLNLDSSSTVDIVAAIQNRADNYLSQIMNAVVKSDEEISDLQRQVNELKAKIQKGLWAKSIRQKEKTAEIMASGENEKIYTTAQVHGSPRSTKSDDMFDSDQSPNRNMGNNVSINTSSHHANYATKNVNMERTKQHSFAKETRNHSSQDANFCNLIEADSSPESSRSKESTPKSMNRSNYDVKSSISKRQSNSPKNLGKKSDRHSFGDSGEQSHEEMPYAFGRKEQSP
ncbi:BRISC complex subunit FAM175B-like [Belonocnema kinseyi]|uniref:BRISC complex subunit FAM175B-like n=1 Tax=Belonocnema kinseyi TaxID=2817044 RepID=UPI00143DAF6D|nr:BRISC complex subunit FAM175B-like [Belonocnema kinseyi]